MTESKTSKRKVLVVDNNEEVLQALQAELETLGLDTRVTWSGREALSLLGAGDFDVLLVDDYLPDLHASDFLDQVQRLPIQPWVVVMRSSPPKPSELRHYNMLGVSAVVDKRDGPKVYEAVRSCCADEPLAKAHLN